MSGDSFRVPEYRKVSLKATVLRMIKRRSHPEANLKDARRYSIMSEKLSRVFSSFPDGRDAFVSLAKAKLDLPQHIDWTPNFSAISMLLRNGHLSSWDVQTWRNNLQNYPDFETNFELSQAIGMLTLGCGEIQHVFLIPDGDRRWAARYKIPITEAHHTTFINVLPSLAEELFSFGVHTFSFWATTTKNFFRSPDEVIHSLIKGVMLSLDVYLELSDKMQVRVSRLGDRKCPVNHENVVKAFEELMIRFDQVEEKTKHFSKHQVNFLFNYDRPGDLTRTVKRILEKGLGPEEITSENVLQFTDLGEQSHRSPDIQMRCAMSTAGGRPGNNMIDQELTCTYYTIKSAPEMDIFDIFSAAAVSAHPNIRYRSPDHNILY